MSQKRPPGSPDEKNPDDNGAPPISFVFTDEEKKIDSLDAAVLHSIMLLTQATGHDFADHQMPSTTLLDWLSEANLKEVDGMLIATLRRWHQLQGPEEA